MATAAAAGATIAQTPAMLAAVAVTNVAMLGLQVGMMIWASKRNKKKKNSTDEINYVANSTVEPMPRVYGTVRLGPNMAWFGNFYSRETPKDQTDNWRY